MSKVYIGMTDGRMFDLYADWMTSFSADIEIIRLGYQLGNFEAVERCQGLVFTGGEDVHPQHYGRLDYLDYCVPSDFDIQRDTFELRLLHYVAKHPLPVLGICRGLQLINVYYGGTLIPDLPTWGKFNHAKLSNGDARDHVVRVDTYSLLFRMVQSEQGIINSLHHQSADRLGTGLVASAVSQDGVVEAIEWKEPVGKPFLCLVQWHPERMKGSDTAFMRAPGEGFLEAVIEHKAIKQKAKA